MILLINSYSFVVAGFLVALLVALITWRLVSPSWAVATVVVTVTTLGLVQSMASTKVELVSHSNDFDSALASGKPVLLELYSNF